jgi:hypothetical protein
MSTSGQCQCTTLKGSQCKNRATQGNMCSIHSKQCSKPIGPVRKQQPPQPKYVQPPQPKRIQPPQPPPLGPMPVTYTLHQGRYFLGDISYIMKDDAYNWWVDVKHGANGLHTFNGDDFVVVSVPDDGIYPATVDLFGTKREHKLCTDASNFGLVPTFLMDEEKEKIVNSQVDNKECVLGRKFIFNNPVKYTVGEDKYTISDGGFTITIYL